jgi:hypothetical protein
MKICETEHKTGKIVALSAKFGSGGGGGGGSSSISISISISSSSSSSSSTIKSIKTVK